jgi:hypothetical protein
MTSTGRSDRATLLAAVAVLGLVVAPLLHAEEHQREGHDDEAQAWTAGSNDPVEALAFALEHAHDPQRAKARDGHRHGHEHGHSHGPAGSGPHGSGALQHLAIALHAAPQLPQIALDGPHHAAPAKVAAQLSGTLRYLIPEWSQGPPVDC